MTSTRTKTSSRQTIKKAKAAKRTTIEREIQRIGHDVLHVETLETRNRDSLDFYELSVWQIRKALEAAYNAGAASRSGRALQRNAESA